MIMKYDTVLTPPGTVVPLSTGKKSPLPKQLTMKNEHPRINRLMLLYRGYSVAHTTQNHQPCMWVGVFAAS